MDENGEKKGFGIAEKIFDIVCLAASYGILFALPQKITPLFYLIFGIAAFLFCIGFFRLGFTFDGPAGSKGALLTGVLFAVFGTAINAAGLYGIFRDHGSERSIIIETLLLIEGICLWRIALGGRHFNTQTSEIQTVPGMQTPIEQLKHDFAGVETQLGRPWIGKVKTIKQDSIIYGPSEDGFIIYGYYNYGKFYVSGSTNPLFPYPEDAQNHTVTEIPDSNGILLAKENLPEAYADMFARYAENGTAYWSTDLSGQP